MITASAAEPPRIGWSWEEGTHHRFYIENEVHLPAPVMLYQEFNTEARLVAVQTKLVLDCSLVREKRREWELRCDIADIAFTGAGMLGDGDNLDSVLKEVDERLSDAYLQIMLRRDGRVRHIDLEGMDRRNRRLSQNVETLRLILARAIAGMDFVFARNLEDEGHGWGQFDSLLMATPYNRGNQGTSEIVHVVRRSDDTRITVESQGRGVAAQATDQATGPANKYMMEMSAMSRFDTSIGVLQQRKWTVIGEPTAGSAVNDGIEGIDYLQAGSLVYLPEGSEMPILPESSQAAVPGAQTPTTLQQWSPIPALME